LWEIDAMATLTRTRAPVKTDITFLDIHQVCDGSTALYVETTCGRRVCGTMYHVERINCDDLAWQLTKFSCDRGSDAEAESYAVNLTMRTCECKGFLRWDKQCKHLATLVTLHAEGRLP
jgi:hypothetical protein